jgi:integrase
LALRGAIATPQSSHRAALTDPGAFGALLRAIDGYEGTPDVRAALQLQALTFVRPVELRGATWKEFDLDTGVWSIPAARMKMRLPHRARLLLQAKSLLNGLRAITGSGEFLFPSVRSATRSMSESTINAAVAWKRAELAHQIKIASTPFRYLQVTQEEVEAAIAADEAFLAAHPMRRSRSKVEG